MSNTSLEQDITTLENRLTVMHGWLDGKVVLAYPKGASTSPAGVYDPKALPESDIPWDWDRFNYVLQEKARPETVWLAWRGENNMPDIFADESAMRAAHAARPYDTILAYGKQA